MSSYCLYKTLSYIIIIVVVIYYSIVQIMCWYHGVVPHSGASQNAVASRYIIATDVIVIAVHN